MIAFWNRKEVFAGYSLKGVSEARDILVTNNIKYKFKIVNANNRHGLGTGQVIPGTFGENINYSKMYYLFVHEEDDAKACSVLLGIKRDLMKS